MDDIIMEAANCFDITLHSYSRSKAAFFLDAEAGVFVLKKQQNTNKIDALYQITESLHKAGFKNTERYMTANGKPYAVIKDGIYTASLCGSGYKCNLNNIDDVLAVAKSLAKLHCTDADISGGRIAASETILSSYYAKKIAGLRHIKKWLGRQSRLSDIDVLFIKNYNEFLSKAAEASAQICEATRNTPLCLCLGEIKEDNIFIDAERQVTLANLEKCVLSAPVTDLCQLIRRFVKRGGNASQIPQIIAAYSEERALSSGDIKLLKAYLSFPHKYFALISKYYNGKKAYGGTHAFLKLNADVQHQEKIYTILNNI